jgi:hypothetical protein
MKNIGTRLYGYHHITAILVPPNWFGCRLKQGITTPTLVKMGWKESWEEMMWEKSLEEVCCFGTMTYTLA